MFVISLSDVIRCCLFLAETHTRKFETNTHTQLNSYLVLYARTVACIALDRQKIWAILTVEYNTAILTTLLLVPLISLYCYSITEFNRIQVVKQTSENGCHTVAK